jgi:hypothetical protein
MLEQIPPFALAAIGAAIGLIASFVATKVMTDEQTERLETTIQDVLEQSGIFYSPKVVGKDKSFITEAVTGKVGESKVDIHYTDSTFYLPATPSDMKNIKKTNVLDKLPYRPERYDSDDYSQSFSLFTSFLYGVNSVGTVIERSTGESYNIIVYGDGSVELYNSKDGEELDDDYTIEEALILF